MGIEDAETTETLETDTETTEELDTAVDTEVVDTGEEGEAAVEDSEDGESGDGTTQPEFTQEQVNDFIGKRTKRFASKNKAITEERDSVSERNTILEEQLKIQKIALEQARSQAPLVTGPPDPDKFDGGEYDAEYKKQESAYAKTQIKQEIVGELAEAKAKEEEFRRLREDQANFNDHMNKHYVKASALKAKDFYEVENKAVDIIGEEIYKIIVRDWPEDSPAIIYHLGKNEKAADKIVALAKAKKDVQAIREVERLNQSIKVKPKKTTNAADPDEDLEGRMPSSRSGKRGPKGATFT